MTMLLGAEKQLQMSSRPLCEVGTVLGRNSGMIFTLSKRKRWRKEDCMQK